MSKFWPVVTMLMAFLIMPFTVIGQDVPTAFLNLHEQQILQGKMYDHYYPNIEGHQYWEASVYKIGTIDFEGVTYLNIPLYYDSYNNLVVTPLVQTGLSQNIVLDNSRIQGFQINSHNFIHIRDSTNILDPGFYIQAFDAPELKLFIKTRKIVVGNTGRPGELLKKFVTQETHILIVEEEKYIVKNKKEVLNALSSEPDLVGFIRSSKLSFRKNHMTTSLLTVLRRL